MVLSFGTLGQKPKTDSLQGQSGVKNHQVVHFQHSTAAFLDGTFAGKMPFFCFKNNQRISLQTDQYVWKLLHAFLGFFSQHKALDIKRCFILMTITCLGNVFLPSPHTALLCLNTSHSNFCSTGGFGSSTGKKLLLDS